MRRFERDRSTQKANRVARITLVCLAAMSTPLLAQSAGEGGDEEVDRQQQDYERQADGQAQEMETVVVTGTAARNRTASYTLSPVDVLTSEDLMSTGQPSFARALRDLLPSFNMPQAAVRGSATEAIRPAQLRGLPPGNTVVLINGKRYHKTAYTNTSGFSAGTSPVDLNTIPMAAIARIEVLRDGAAALYGSDAIAGVINIILKGGPQQGSFAKVSHGGWDGGEGDTWRAGASTAFSLGNNGWIRLSANYLRQLPTQHAGPDMRYPEDPTYGEVTMHFGLPYERAKQFGFNMEFPLGEAATLYGFTLISKRNVGGTTTFRSLSQYKDSFPEVVPLVPEGYLPQHHQSLWDDNSTLGVRGQLWGWDYDVAVTNGGNRWKHHLSNSVNKSLGAASPRSFYMGTHGVRQTVFNADFRRQLDIGLASPISLAWGYAWRHQEYTVKAGEWAAFYASGSGVNSVDAGSTTRKNQALYVDTALNLGPKFTLELQSRYEHYSDFGNAFIWGVKGRYQFIPAFAMRATVGTGFRAPSVQQLGYSDTGITHVHIDSGEHAGELVPFVIKTFKPTDPAAVALGAEPLDPETSQNISLGFVWTPVSGPTITLDLYQVEVDDQIQWTANLVGPEVRKFLQSYGFEFVGGGRFYTNLTNIRVRGVDLVGSWPVRLGGARLNFRFGYNYNKHELISVNPHPDVWNTIGLNPVLGRGAHIPNRSTKGFASANWQSGAWSVNARVTRYSSWTLRLNNPAYDYSYDARYLTDVSLHYGWNDWTFVAGIDNIFNVYPEDNSDSVYGYSGNIVYPNDAPMGYNGRHWYASAAYRW